MNQTKQDLRKDQILDAALTVLIQNGYEGSRMDDVVTESQLSKGAIYWYYKSKKAMYLDLVNFWVIRYSATINHLVENDQAAPDQLKSLFNYFIDQYESDPDPFIALTEFWSMAQKDDDFRANISRGGEGIPYQMDDEIEWLGGECARLLGLDIAGVDLLFHNGGYVICEVNSSPGFEGMDSYTKTNIAEQIVTYVKHKIGYSDNRNET